jgi:hypothetical protein
MSDKYYIKLKFEYGKVTQSGPDVKNDGVITWTDMDYDEVTAFEHFVVVPGLCKIQTDAAEAGYSASKDTVRGK